MGKKIVWGRLLDFIYPRHCPVCNTIRPVGASPVCPKCVEQLLWVKEPVCFRCGKPVAEEEQEYCRDCRMLPKHYIRGYPAVIYTDKIQSAIYGLKYKNRRDYAEFLGECILQRHGKELKALKVDGMVPVPIHKRKWRQRGYNQAELIAGVLAKRLDIPLYKDYLIRVINTSPQKELNDAGRMKNLKSAFKMGQNTIKLKKILLVDDIYTSGATIEACTQVLLKDGAEEIYYTSVAIGQGYSD